MSWLDNALEEIRKSKEPAVDFGAPLSPVQSQMMGMVGGYLPDPTAAPDAQSAGVAAALGGAPSNGLPNTPFSFAMPAAPQTPVDPAALGPAFSYPTSQPTEKYIDYSQGWPIELERPKAKFGDIPQAPPAAAAPPQMAAQSAVSGLNSPVGGGGAPFSLGGPDIPPSVKLASAIATPQPPAANPAAAPPAQGGAGLPAPVAAPAAPARPVAPAAAPSPAVAEAEGSDPDGTATDISARRRGTPPARAVAGDPGAPMGIPDTSAGAPSAAGGSFLQSLSSGLKSVAPALLGVGGALQGDMGATTRSILADQQKKDEQTQTANLTARALLSKGVDPTTVAAAIKQPELMKALVADNFARSKYKVQKTGQDEFGNEQYAAINENDPTDFKPIVNGRVVDGKTASPGADTPTASAGGGYLAPGVKAVDHSLVGEDYLKQYSPEVQSAVKNYISGETMPTANPRKGWVQNIKSIAQTYGASTGQPVDDATFSARRTMRNDLAKTSPGSIGGQISIGNTALGHLADLSQKAVELGNVDVGLAGPSHLINDVRGMTSAQSAKMEALKGAAQHYGQEVTKFYSGSPGGEAERNRFLETVNGAKTPQELGAVLATEAALMKDRISSLQSNIQTTLGPDGVAKYPVIRDVGQSALAQIEANTAKLRGGGAAPTAAPVAVSSKAQYDALAPGVQYTAPDGTLRIKK